jgi:aminoacyl tRNA synthase complex-interacting multifunctional protein 1
MRGVKSEGMVLCATGADGKVEILLPPKDAKPGDKAFFETFEEGQPDSVLNPKKKVWETIQPGLFTDDEKRGAYKFQEEGKPERVCLFKTATGVITTATVTKGTIK